MTNSLQGLRLKALLRDNPEILRSWGLIFGAHQKMLSDLDKLEWTTTEKYQATSDLCRILIESVEASNDEVFS